PRFRPYANSVHLVAKGHYITSNDPRGYIPVYEYPLNSQWIMMDIDDGYILWTEIWKADIVKMIDSQPDLAGVIRRVRGGYLKIQGTWMPFEVGERLARRVAWTIRDDLIPLFGPNFPSTCLAPDQSGYGQVVASASGRRRARRNPQPQPALAPTSNTHARGSWPQNPHPNAHPPAPWPSNPHPSQFHPHPHGIPLHQPSPFAPIPLPAAMQRLSSSSHGSLASSSSRGSLSLEMPALSIHDGVPSPARPSDANNPPMTLPAIQPPKGQADGDSSLYALPPISALEDLRGVDAHRQDPTAVLRRLQADDDVHEADVKEEEHQRRILRSLSVPTARYVIFLLQSQFIYIF
ncbi:transcription regulator HTH, apses-type DNA-binding domain-containing protein, partial [Mycena crocata]